MKNNNGYVAMFICVIMPVVIAVLGFCIDGSTVLYNKARLATAVKFAAVSATSNHVIHGENLIIKMEQWEFVEKALQSNFPDAVLSDFTINPDKQNECTVVAEAEITLLFSKFFNYNSETITESYSAERNLIP